VLLLAIQYYLALQVTMHYDTPKTITAAEQLAFKLVLLNERTPIFAGPIALYRPIYQVAPVPGLSPFRL
jgi:hypothetical protein